MLNSLLTNRYLLRLIRDYVQFQFDNNTHIAASNGIKPSYSASLADAISEPVVIFTDNSPAPESNTYIFKSLLDDDKEYQDFVKSIPITTYHTLGLFSCNKDERINGIHTGSTTSNHSNYYLPIYNKLESSVDAYHEFDISYAHISGSGSSYIEVDGDYETEYLPSKTMYRKYMLECFEKTDGKFHFKNDKNGEHFYILQFGRDSFKDRLDPGNFQLSLAAYPSFLKETEIEITSDQFLTASRIFTLIDNSSDGNEYVSETEEVKDYYYLVSGSLQDGIYDEPESDGWGVIFPNKGIVILDATVLDNTCSLETTVSSINGNNPYKLFLSISSSLTPLSTVDNVKTNFTKLSAAGTSTYTFGIKNNGTLWSWGLNTLGQLGLGDTINRSSPVQIGTDTNWKDVNGNYDYTLAMKTDGTLWAWGVNNARYGDNTSATSLSPKQISSAYLWQDIIPLAQGGLGIKYDGSIWSWGNNSFGILGLNIGTSQNRSSAVQIGSETNWSKIYGSGLSANAIKNDGTLWAWGKNDDGELGIRNTSDRSSPVQVGQMNDWNSLYSSGRSKLAIKIDGSLWGWGLNTSGQIGIATTSSISSPVQIGNINNPLDVAMGLNYTMMISTDSILYSAGSNSSGQIIKTKPNQTIFSPVYSEIYERENTGSFFARSMEKKIVETYFCRVMPGEMMYSNNPTYLSGSAENVKYRYFQRHGGTYITTIGLYNNNKELLAIGKLKKPIFRKNNVETIFQVRVRMN